MYADSATEAGWPNTGEYYTVKFVVTGGGMPEYASDLSRTDANHVTIPAGDMAWVVLKLKDTGKVKLGEEMWGGEMTNTSSDPDVSVDQSFSYLGVDYVLRFYGVQDGKGIFRLVTDGIESDEFFVTPGLSSVEVADGAAHMKVFWTNGTDTVDVTVCRTVQSTDASSVFDSEGDLEEQEVYNDECS